MKKRHKKNTTRKKINREQLVSMLNFFRVFFDREEDYNDLVNYIVDNYKNIDYEEKEYAKLLLRIRNKAYHYIALKVQNGDIDLEINVIENHMKHLYSILPKYKNWIKDSKEPYLQLLNEEMLIDNTVEKEFLKHLFENAIINTINNYDGEELFTIAILNNFKKELTNIEAYFIDYTNSQKVMRYKNE